MKLIEFLNYAHTNIVIALLEVDKVPEEDEIIKIRGLYYKVMSVKKVDSKVSYRVLLNKLK